MLVSTPLSKVILSCPKNPVYLVTPLSSFLSHSTVRSLITWLLSLPSSPKLFCFVFASILFDLFTILDIVDLLLLLETLLFFCSTDSSLFQFSSLLGASTLASLSFLTFNCMHFKGSVPILYCTFFRDLTHFCGLDCHLKVDNCQHSNSDLFETATGSLPLDELWAPQVLCVFNPDHHLFS